MVQFSITAQNATCIHRSDWVKHMQTKGGLWKVYRKATRSGISRLRVIKLTIHAYGEELKS